MCATCSQFGSLLWNCLVLGYFCYSCYLINGPWRKEFDNQRSLVNWGEVTCYFAIPVITFSLITQLSFNIWYCKNKKRIEEDGGFGALFARNSNKQHEPSSGIHNYDEDKEERELIEIPNCIRCCALTASI